jgi:glycosyltransferase involved in cell wall biosynthesis
MPVDTLTMRPGAQHPLSVSIVIPTHDPAPRLPRVIERLIAQRYEGTVEILVVVDGAGKLAGIPSPPSLSGTLRRALRTMINDGTPGLPGARRAGRLAAHGEIVVFCGDDEEWPPGRLREIVERRVAALPAAEAPGTAKR